MEVKVFDNITEIVRDDMISTIRKDSKISIAASCFSMYAYKELKKQLEAVDECRFIFTSPTFVAEKTEKQKREFYIPRLNREKSLYGTEFELKLRNELTQKAIARECADWIKRKATFKSNTTGENMGGFMTVADTAHQIAYMPMNGFTTVDIGCERGNNSYNMVNRFEAPFSASYIQLFETLWNDNDYCQNQLSLLESNIKPDRTDLDLLFGCLLEWGLPLSLPYHSEEIEGCRVHNYNDGDLIACFDENIPDSVIRAIARKQPLRAVFRDSSFIDSPSKINVGEIFKLLAPDTRVKVI